MEDNRINAEERVSIEDNRTIAGETIFEKDNRTIMEKEISAEDNRTIMEKEISAEDNRTIVGETIPTEDYKAIVEEAIIYIKELFSTDSGGHDAEHSIRVYQNALRIAEDEPLCDRQIVALAALLHDADDHKLFHTENNANARAFLSRQQITAEQTEKICRVINAVSFTRNKGRRPDTLEGRIVQDADRLDAIGATGIARTFAFGGEHGRPLEDSIRHFYDKLLLLKDLMNTQSAKKMAQTRHEFLVEFLRNWDEERKQ